MRFHAFGPTAGCYRLAVSPLRAAAHRRLKTEIRLATGPMPVETFVVEGPPVLVSFSLHLRPRPIKLGGSTSSNRLTSSSYLDNGEWMLR